MEARVAKLEIAAEYIQRDVAEIKGDLKHANGQLIRFAQDVNAEFRTLRAEMRSESWRLLAAFGGGFALLLGAMAAGFGWF